eukprot:652064-Rhodomonas_salina.1
MEAKVGHRRKEVCIQRKPERWQVRGDTSSLRRAARRRKGEEWHSDHTVTVTAQLERDINRN